MKEKKQLTAREVGQLLGTPMVTVLRWAHQGKIPCKRKENAYIFKKTEIIAWARSHDLLLEKQEHPPRQEEEHGAVLLAKAIERGGIIRDLEGGDIYTVLKNAVHRIELPEDTDREMVFNELINREEIASTGIGKGVAIPHPRAALNLNLEKSLIPAIFLKRPVDFNAVDGEDIFLLFMMFSPNTQVHLKLLSRLSLCLRDEEFLSLLRKKDDENLWLNKIAQIERKLADSPAKP
jgi:PTS system nitrogen regulatory IIA component